MLIKDREFFQYKSGDLLYIISPLACDVEPNLEKYLV